MLLLALVGGCRSPEPVPEEGDRTERRDEGRPDATARGPRCVVCGEAITGRYVELEKKLYHAECYERRGPRCGVCHGVLHGGYVSLGEALDYHTACWEATSRCDGCGLPAGGSRGPAARWKDGRVTCVVCKKEAVTEAAEAKRLLDDARALLRAQLSLDLGSIEIPIKLVSRPELMAQAEELGQPAIKALTVVREEGPSRDGARGARTYKILALYGLPRPALVGILGHELFHVLQSEATGDEKDAAFREGSANYVQVALLRARGEAARARLIERDTDPIYGEGLRRFQRLVKARGEKDALLLGARSVAFPRGF